MNDPYVLSLVFGAGVIVQGLLLVNPITDWKAVGLSLLIGLFGMLPGKRERIYHPLLHIFLFFVWFSVALTGFLRAKILPRINEQVLLQLNIVLWYAIAATTPILQVAPELSLLLLVPTVLTFAVAFYPRSLSRWAQVVSYIWFLVISTGLILLHFTYGTLAVFFDPSHIGTVPFEDLFFSGMSFFILCTYGWMVFELLPLRGKHESLGAYNARHEEMIAFVDDRHSDEQLGMTHALLIIFGFSTFLFLNYFYHWASPWFVINTALLIVPNFSVLTGRRMKSHASVE